MEGKSVDPGEKEPRRGSCQEPSEPRLHSVPRCSFNHISAFHQLPLLDTSDRYIAIDVHRLSSYPTDFDTLEEASIHHQRSAKTVYNDDDAFAGLGTVSSAAVTISSRENCADIGTAFG